MGMHFTMRRVRPLPDGTVAEVEGLGAAVSVDNRDVFAVLDGIEERKRVRGVQPSLFPWYQRSFDYYGAGRKPTVADCFKPKEVLSSLQGIERELQKNTAKYPREWWFLVPQPDGKHTRVFGQQGLSAVYRGKLCRLFGDEQGCWAVELDTPLAFPVHYELTGMPEVVVQMEAGGPDVRIGIEQRSFLTVQGPMLQKFKSLCIMATQANELLLTYSG